MRSPIALFFVAALASASLCALLALLIGAAMGMAELRAGELTPGHVIFACLAANAAGSTLYAVLARRGGPRRARIQLGGAALVVATLATVRVVIAPPEPGFAAIAGAMHYVVAITAALALPWFARGPSCTPDSPAPAARVLISLAAVFTILSTEVADFNATHFYNEAWPPHARYHGVLLMCAMVGVGLASLALLWRPAAHSAERPLRVAIAALLPAMIWGSFFLALLVPGTSSWPDGTPRSFAIAPNVIAGGIVVALCVAGWTIDRRARRSA
jgi:hypothetical protein